MINTAKKQNLAQRLLSSDSTLISILTVLLCITFLAWHETDKYNHEKASIQFKGLARDSEKALIHRMDSYEDALLGGVGFFAGSSHVSRDEWRKYVEAVDVHARYPGINGIGYIEYVKKENLEQYLEEVRKDGAPNFKVKPDGEYDDFFIIQYIEPLKINEAAVGLNIAFEKNRRDGATLAIDSGKTAITKRILLVQDAEKTPGFLLLLPIYKNGASNSNIAERRENFLGWIYAPFIGKNFMKDLTASQDNLLHIHVFDGENESEDEFIYNDDDKTQGDEDDAKFIIKKTITIKQQPWTITWNSTNAFEESVASNEPLLVLIGGITLSLLISSILFFIARMYHRANDLASQMTEELYLSLQEQQAIFNTVVDGIVTINEKGLVLSFNNSAENIFGYKSNDIIGNNINMLMPEPYHKEHDGYLSNYLRTGEAKVIGVGREVTAKRKDGSIFPMELGVSGFQAGGKKIFVGIIRDITERKEAEEKLEKTTKKLELILDNVGEGIYGIDLEGHTIFCNNAASNILGYTIEEMLGKSQHDLIHHHYPNGDEYPKSQCPIYKSFTDGSSHIESNEVFWSKDNIAIPVEYTVAPIIDKAGTISGSVVTYRDISERKKSEEAIKEYAEKMEWTNFELEAAKNEAEAANVMKGEFVSVVSHELRTPLTSIRGSLGLVIGAFATDLPEKVRGLLDIAHNNCERLILLINDILDMDKIAAGQMRFDMREEILADITQQAVDSNQAYAEKFNTSIALQPIDQSIKINVDSARYIQVLSNLLSNAAKFSPKGKNIDVFTTQNDSNIRISVKDYGEGIPEKFRSKIFEKFLQADSSGTRSKGGTGLGLHITKQIVENMGGSIWFETETNKGTTFWAEFPILGKEEKINNEIKYNDGATILICEDARDISIIMQAMLENAGLKSDLAHNISEAKEMLKHKSYEVMTVDNQLTDGDGITFINELRQKPATSALPIIVVSGNKKSARLDVDSNLKINAWIEKPIDEKLFISTLKKIISSSSNLPEILHIEDDVDLSKIIATALSGKAKIINATTIEKAKKILKRKHFSTIILDMGLPDGSGEEILDILQKFKGSTPPVLVLSANELPSQLRDKVSEAIVKSKVSESKIIERILYLVEQNGKGK